MVNMALVGNPNAGKTRIFNALTGSNQATGNWSGVTVGRCERACKIDGHNYLVSDLPGCYSLTFAVDGVGLDQRLTQEYLLNNKVDVIINVVDGLTLGRHLYLTTQLLELQIPMIIIVTKTDLVADKGNSLDLAGLGSLLSEAENSNHEITDIPHGVGGRCSPHLAVIGLNCNSDSEIFDLKRMLHNFVLQARAIGVTHLPENWLEVVAELENLVHCAYGGKKNKKLLSLCYLEGAIRPPASIASQVSMCLTKLSGHCQEPLDIAIADFRYRYVKRLKEVGQVKSSGRSGWRLTSHDIDKIVLHRWAGMVIFLGVMYLLFWLALGIGGMLQSPLELITRNYFVAWPGQVLTNWGVAPLVVDILSNGVGQGLVTALNFAPVLTVLFVFLTWLEECGYMARAAFLVDRIMQWFGLPGQAFVAMMIGFGCNVPAVMAARTLDSERDRILTIMMAPFMSCSARLAIYAVFVSTFFPTNGHNIIMGLYLLGIVAALFTAVVLQKTIVGGVQSKMIIELPSYHRPLWRRVWAAALRRLVGFVRRALKLIIPISCILSGLTSVQVGGESVLISLAHFVAPLFAPLGVGIDNWPAIVAIFTGVIAKEVVIGSLNSLYVPDGGGLLVGDGVMANLHDAGQLLLANMHSFWHSLSHPLVFAVGGDSLVSQARVGLEHNFTSLGAVFAYLVFILLYFPCVSTMAVIAKELNRRWAVFSVVWATVLAYTVALIVYQLAEFRQHIVSSGLIIMGVVIGYLVAIIGVRLWLRSSVRAGGVGC